MKRMKVSTELLRGMAGFYLKTIFGGIPEIDIDFDEDSDIPDDALGTFILQKNPDYNPDTDELNKEYHGYVDLGNGVGYDDGELPWTNVLNKPVPMIRIRKSLGTDIVELTITLLHELCHYYCWYLGYEHGDKDSDFIDLCNRLGIATNYDHVWDGRRWILPKFYKLKAIAYMEMFCGIRRNIA